MQLTFLQGVQRAYRESGLLGTGPVSVLNQVGRNADFVRWYGDAWEEIQRLPNWNFDWARTEFTLVSGQAAYDPVVDFGITGGIKELVRDGAYVYRSTDGLASRLWLGYMDWPIFRDLPVPPVPGMPNTYSMRPDGKIQYWPEPNQTYFRAVHEYWQNPQVLAADADIPRLDPKYHLALVFKTVQFYAEMVKDWSRRDSAQERYDSIMDGTFNTQSQKWITGGPLA